MLLSGDAAIVPDAGYGVAQIRAHHAGDGEVSYIVNAVDGASGFHAIIPAE